jgi:hypothetical protein
MTTAETQKSANKKSTRKSPKTKRGTHEKSLANLQRGELNEYGIPYPSKYKPEYALFETIDSYLEYCRENCVPEVVTVKGSKATKKSPAQTVIIPRFMLPTKEGFARRLRVDSDTLLAWEKRYPDFAKAMRYLMDTQKDVLLNQAGAGQGHSTIQKLALMSNHGMKEVKETDNKHSFGLLRQIYNEGGQMRALESGNVRDVDVFNDDEEDNGE